jgi:hypothetical protein
VCSGVRATWYGTWAGKKAFLFTLYNLG